MLFSLYIHIPFCVRKCAYCDFCSFPACQDVMAGYCAALERELALTAARFPDAQVDTVFVGGGTPSVLPAQLLDGVLAEAARRFVICPDAEYSVEANPGTLCDAWLDTARAHGVNRLSLGVQARQEHLLASLGRIHGWKDAVAAARMARAHGFCNLNMDVMFGLPGQMLSDYLETLDEVTALAPEHVSAYSLIVEEGTPLAARVASGQSVLPEEDAVADMMTQGADALRRHGYQRYEISNFAKAGFACRHNIGYWQGKPYFGVGLGAHAMLPPDDAQASGGARYVRAANTADLSCYLRALNEDALPTENTQMIGADEAMLETLMLGLRMTAGVETDDFIRRHGVAPDAVCGARIDALRRDGLMLPPDRTPSGHALALTERGLMLQNIALMRLLEPFYGQ